MSEATNTKETCPHCDTPYYPIWTTNALSSVSPSRQETITLGDLGATTCTSCDEPILNLFLLGPVRQKSEGMPEQAVKPQRIFPPESRIVIEIIVQIFIDFEHVRRQEEREPEMTDDEEETMRQSYTEFFLSVLEGARLARGTAQVLERFRPFFEPLLKLLPPPE